MSHPRDALAAAAFGLVASASYVLQRLASWWAGEVPGDLVLGQAHIPYYWRVALALLHGVLVAAILRSAVPVEAARRWLPRVRMAVLPVVAVLFVLTLAVP